MPERAEHLYCSQQIIIPPRFPHILKEFAKDAIRTQPYDLLPWAAAYFRCLAEGVPVPAKRRIEIPPTVVESGLTPGFILVLLKQFGKGPEIQREALWKRWMGVCLCEYELKKMLTIGRMLKGDTIPWMHFVALMAGYLTNSLSQTMILICELLTDEPDGGSAMIPFWRFKDMYLFLAKLDCGSPQQFKGGRKILKRTNSQGILEEYLESDVSSVTESITTSSSTDVIMEKSDAVNKSDDFYDGPCIESVAIKSDDSIVPPPPPDPQDVESDITIDDKSITSYEKEETTTEEIDPTEMEGPTEREDVLEEQIGTETEVKHEADIRTIQDIETFSRHESEEYDENPDHEDEDDEEHSKDNLRKTSSKFGIFDTEKTHELGHDGPTEDHSNMLFLGQLPITSGIGNQLIELDQYTDLEAEEEEVKETKEKEDVCLPQYTGLKWKPREVLHVNEIKGIGPAVPDSIVTEFLCYMQDCAKKQHNMVMPRNLRHYLCPPMEEEVTESEGAFEDTEILF